MEPRGGTPRATLVPGGGHVAPPDDRTGPRSFATLPSSQAPTADQSVNVTSPGHDTSGFALVASAHATGPGALTRRLVLAGGYAVLTVLLARAVAQDIDGVQSALEGIGGVLPRALQRLGPDPASLALVSLGLVAFMLAAGTYLVSRESGTAFALLAVGTVGWFLFPYSEVPWATAFTGAQQLFLEPPITTWLMGGLIVTIALVEVVSSAHDAVARALTSRRLAWHQVRPAIAQARRSSMALFATSLVGGGAVAVLYHLFRDVLGTGLLREPNLVLVPALLGLAGGLAIWWTSRNR